MKSIQVDVPVVGDLECNVAYSGEIVETMLCAGQTGKDSCQVCLHWENL